MDSGNTTREAATTPSNTAGDQSPKPWFKKKRFMIPLVLVILAVLGNLGDDSEEESKDSTTTTVAAEANPSTTSREETTTVAPTTTVKPTTTLPPPPEPIVLSGSSDQATAAFDVEGGFTTFKTTYRGSSNFAIQLLDEQGKTVDLLVNEIGSYEGTTAQGLSAGKYLLKVTASGPWTATVEQPRAVEGAPLPAAVDGKGQSVIGPFKADGGSVRTNISHSGSSNFAVYSLDEEGNNEDLVVNEIGGYQGQPLASVSEDLFYFKIEADGAWHIDLSNL